VYSVVSGLLVLQTARHVRFPPFHFFFHKQYITAALAHNAFGGPPELLLCETLLSAFAINSGSRLILATAQDADVMIDERYMRNAMDWNGGRHTCTVNNIEPTLHLGPLM
jgi:hypothetical protein